MNANDAVTVGFALCCVLAIGLSAAGMESAVGTEPDDVVDVDTDVLPVGSDDVDELKRRAVEAESGDLAAVSAPVPASDGERRSESERREAGDEQLPDRSERRETSAGGGAGPSESADQARGEDESRGSEPAPPDLIDRLLDLLPAIVAALLVLATLLFAYRYRERIAAALVRSGFDSGGGDSGDAPTAAPSNDVAEAWYEMVRSLDLDRDASKTASEYAREAIAAGVDPDVVALVTRTFEDVRYGGRPPTEERCERAWHAVTAIDERHGDGSGRDVREGTA